MDTLLNAFLTALDLCFYYFIWQGIFTPKVSRKRYLASLGVGWLVLLLLQCSGILESGKYLLSVPVLAALSILINDGYWADHLYAALVGVALGAAITYSVSVSFSTIIHIPMEKLLYQKMLYSLITVVAKLIFVCMGWYVCYFLKYRKTVPLRGKWLPVCVVFTGISLTVILSVSLSVSGTTDISAGVLFLCGVIVAANVAILYLVSSLEKSIEKLQASALLRQQMDIQTEHILALEKSYRAQRQTTHDFRNQLQTVSDLLDMDKAEEAKAYTKELLGQQTTRIFAVNSHHPIMDAVLNHKYQLCREKEIDIRFQVNDLSKVDLPTDLLLVLLSNLLDNAIEGCCRYSGKKKLSCTVIAEDALFLSVRNTANPVTIVDNRIPTSKEDPQEHGCGMALIQSAMEKLHGEYTFDYQDGWFSFAGEIPLDG